MDAPSVDTLVDGLLSDSDSARKYAVFKLQALLSDPSFADAFCQGDGLLALREAVMQTSGNTQAYALGSLDKLLELDMGWEVVEIGLIEKVSVDWRLEKKGRGGGLGCGVGEAMLICGDHRLSRSRWRIR